MGPGLTKGEGGGWVVNKNVRRCRGLKRKGEWIFNDFQDREGGGNKYVETKIENKNINCFKIISLWETFLNQKTPKTHKKHYLPVPTHQWTFIPFQHRKLVFPTISSKVCQ